MNTEKTLERLLNYSFNAIGWDYDKLTNEEKSIMTREEFEDIKTKFKMQNINSSFYKWGEYKNEYDSLDTYELEKMIQLGDELDGFSIRDEDKNKVFFAYEIDIDGDEEDGYSVKRAYAVERNSLG